MKHLRGPICEHEQTTGDAPTCSLPFLSCHDRVSESAPQSGIDPEEYLIAVMVSQKKKEKVRDSRLLTELIMHDFRE